MKQPLKQGRLPIKGILWFALMTHSANESFKRYHKASILCSESFCKSSFHVVQLRVCVFQREKPALFWRCWTHPESTYWSFSCCWGHWSVFGDPPLLLQKLKVKGDAEESKWSEGCSIWLYYIFFLSANKRRKPDNDSCSMFCCPRLSKNKSINEMLKHKMVRTW